MSKNSPTRYHEFLQSFICGGLAGVVAKTIVAPLDRVKIHFQVNSPTFTPYTGRLRGVFQAIHSLYCEFGFFGLYRGHSMMIARIFPYSAMNFVSYELLKKWIYRDKLASQVPWWQRICTGSLAGVAAVTFTYPLDIIRTRLAFDLSTRPRNASRHGPTYLLMANIRRLISEGRPRFLGIISCFYQGYIPTVVGIVPYAGVSFSTFETLKSLYHQSNQITSTRVGRNVEQSPVPIHYKLVFGVIAGALAQTASYPLDTVRRRLQVLNVAPHLKNIYDKSMVSIFRSIIQEQGIRGLFAGLPINYIKVAPATGISFVVYEFLKQHLFVTRQT